MNAIGENGCALVDSYVAGLDPADSKSTFKTMIEFKDGKPVVSWEPALNGQDENGRCKKTGVRTYRVLGSTDLKTWVEVDDGEEDKFNFFKVGVEMRQEERLQRGGENGIIRGMKALVLGVGKSGKAAAALLKEQGYEVDFADGYDRVVASPGIPAKSELQLGCEELKRRGWNLVAVTGSKGKSSVVKLVAEAINLAGGYAVACGNYGIPVSEVAFEDGSRETEDGKERWAVVEVSSFQLETTTLSPDTFEAAAILNLQEDHLDRHGSVEVYHGLKRKLLGMTRHPIEAGVAPFDKRSGDRFRPLWAGSYFDNEILAGNAAIAVELMRVAGLDDACIAKAFRDFVPLPHRMNLVAEIGGVRYIDDSKATSLSALVAGVKMASSPNPPIPPSPNHPILLIAGGLPKGDDPKMALPILTERVKKVYLIGQCAEAFCSAWKGVADCEICGTLDRAVERAKGAAVKGETVLLSPGTASFDQFQSFGERGDAFARLVKGKEKDK